MFFPEPPETRKVGFSLECFSFFKVMILFNAILLGVEIDVAAKRSQNDMPAWFGIAARTPDDSFFGGPRGGGRRENGGPLFPCWSVKNAVVYAHVITKTPKEADCFETGECLPGPLCQGEYLLSSHICDRDLGETLRFGL